MGGLASVRRGTTTGNLTGGGGRSVMPNRDFLNMLAARRRRQMALNQLIASGGGAPATQQPRGPLVPPGGWQSGGEVTWQNATPQQWAALNRPAWAPETGGWSRQARRNQHLAARGLPPSQWNRYIAPRLRDPRSLPHPGNTYGGQPVLRSNPYATSTKPPGGGYSGGVIPRFQAGGGPDYWPEGCPSPKEHIQLANNDWILAGELKVGDEVMTSEEPQKVTRVQRLENRPRCEVLFEDSDSIVTSYSHPYFVNSKGFVEVGDLEKGDVVGDLVVKDTKPFAMGPVISLSVDKTETYMLQGGTKENPVPVLSHNKSLPEPPPPPRDPNRPIKYYGPWGAPYTTEHRDRWLRRQQVKEGATARKTARTRRLGSRSPGGWQAGGQFPEPAFPVESELADESPWYPDEEVGYEEEFPAQGGFDIFGRSGG